MDRRQFTASLGAAAILLPGVAAAETKDSLRTMSWHFEPAQMLSKSFYLRLDRFASQVDQFKTNAEVRTALADTLAPVMANERQASILNAIQQDYAALKTKGTDRQAIAKSLFARYSNPETHRLGMQYLMSESDAEADRLIPAIVGSMTFEEKALFVGPIASILLAAGATGKQVKEMFASVFKDKVELNVEGDEEAGASQDVRVASQTSGDGDILTVTVYQSGNGACATVKRGFQALYRGAQALWSGFKTLVSNIFFFGAAGAAVGAATGAPIGTLLSPEAAPVGAAGGTLIGGFVGGYLGATAGVWYTIGEALLGTGDPSKGGFWLGPDPENPYPCTPWASC